MKLRITLTFVGIIMASLIFAQPNKSAEIIVLQLNENENFPNNPTLPVLLYKNVFGESVSPVQIEKLFKENNWGGSWRNGIYNFHHYHSTAHEALGVYGGWAEVQLGGEGSEIVRIEKGDLVVLPAGTAHKRISSGDGFAVVGAYPDKQSWDMNYGEKDEMELSKQNIANVALPSADPVFGKNGRMFNFWH